MALRITCPHCGSPLRLEEPYPLPGAERQCGCGRALAITYPVGMIEILRKKGARFAGDSPSAAGAPGLAGAVSPMASPRVGVPLRPGHTIVPEDDPPTFKDGPARHDSPTELATPGPSLVDPDSLPTPAQPRTEPTLRTRLDPPPDPTAPPRAKVSTVLPGRPRDAAGRIQIDPAADPDATAPLALKPRRSDPAAETVILPRKPAKPRGPGLKGWIMRLGGLGVVGTVTAIVLAVIGWYGVTWYYSRDLPSIATLGSYRPSTVTVVYDRRERVLGEIYDERRYVLPLEQIPLQVQQAFLAAEDAGFRDHGGVDYIGIARAVGRNVLQGRKAQGASTITQQVARNFLLSNEKTWTRKIKEILLSWRIEDTFDKDHILYLYLNEIYLGSKAYGVEAAARTYFGKHVHELSLAEAAMIAGLAPRPSDYSPHRSFEKAKARQDYVLGQMAENGFITAAEADAARSAPVEIVRRSNAFLRQAPWFTEHVRQELVKAYGEERVLKEGLVAYTTCDLELQQLAQKSVTDGVTAVDEKKGWRGAEEHLEEAAIAERVATLAKRNDPLLEGERYVGVVGEVARRHMVVDVGTGKVLVPLSWTTWAWAKGGKRPLDDLGKTFTRGDVVTVEVKHADFRAAAPFKDYTEAGEGPFLAGEVFQSPELEGALYSYRLDDGAVLAMVGGVDFVETKFNRAVQAQRQVGSTFKPIVYAAAIASRKFTAGTIVPDAPLAYNTIGAKLWKPENYGSSYLGDITLRRALALSRNVVTIRVLDELGIEPVYQLARQLGIESPMDQDLSMGLGASSLNLPELSRAYSAFATMGRRIEPHTIDRVVDRDGKVLQQWEKPAAWTEVLDPGVASVVNWMLVEVATAGTAAKSNALGLHVAGKTGTTNDNKDVWFVGYTPSVLTTVWVGYDQPRTILSNATGGEIALPIWMEYMKVAAPKADDRAFAVAPGVSWQGVDEATGRPMEGGRSMPFLAGTGPRGAAAVAGQRTSEDLLITEF